MPANSRWDLIRAFSRVYTYPSIKMEQSFPKRRHIKFRRRGITQKKSYNRPFHVYSANNVFMRAFLDLLQSCSIELPHVSPYLLASFTNITSHRSFRSECPPPNQSVQKVSPVSLYSATAGTVSAAGCSRRVQSDRFGGQPYVVPARCDPSRPSTNQLQH